METRLYYGSAFNHKYAVLISFLREKLVLKPYWTFSNVQEFPGMNTLTPRYSRVSVKEHDKHSLSFHRALNSAAMLIAPGNHS